MITRRIFLIGSAVAIAATKAPTAPAFVAPTVPVPAQHVYKRREIWEIMISGMAKESIPAVVDVYPPRCLEPILTLSLNLCGGILRWVALPDNTITLRENELVMLDMHADREIGPDTVAELYMTCSDHVDEGPPVRLFERHWFPARQPVIEFMDTDNSLPARIQREEDRKKIVWSDPAEFCDVCGGQLTLAEAAATERALHTLYCDNCWEEHNP